MSARPITILPTDTRWPGPYHVEEGPECLCSRCGLAIVEPEIAIMAWPDDDPNRDSYRFHPACLGFTTCEPLEEEDDAPQPCGHPWSAVVWLEDETGDCGACIEEERRARGEEDTHVHEGP